MSARLHLEEEMLAVSDIELKIVTFENWLSGYMVSGRA